MKLSYQGQRSAESSHYPLKVAIKGTSGVAYINLNGPRPVAKGYSGKRGKPDWHYGFKSSAQMYQYIGRWGEKVKAAEEWAATKQAERKAAMAAGHPLKVGQILYSSWGYDQTNIDYYEVVSTTKATCEIRKIASKVANYGTGSDAVMPMPGKYIGEPMRKRPNAYGNCHLTSYSSASPWDGMPKHETAAGYGH